MKKLLTLVIASLLTITIVHAQAGWITHQADNRVAVKFPLEPKELIPGSFITSNKDSTVAYIFTMVDFVKVAGIDSTTLAPIKATPAFAAQLKTGIMQGLPNVDLSDFVIGTFKGFTSYTATGLDPKKKKYDIFMFIIGSKLYSFSAVTADGVSSRSKDEFLGTIIITN